MYKQIFEIEKTISTPIDGYPYPLLWRYDLGFGFLKSDGYDYGEEYWEKYQTYVSDVGVQLSLARTDFIKNNIGTLEDLCDVGVGNGQFVDLVKCKGYDINLIAKDWLEKNGYYADVYSESFKTLSFWDVLEHIEDPSDLLNKTENIFTSIPIHKDLKSCLESKHLRPGEHIWHFTDKGIKNFMNIFGFKVIASSNFETRLGREAINSYYFKKNI
jgi:hypothetical protein